MIGAGATPLYQKVKDHILTGIAAGDFAVGERVPSENELVETLRISRMTANRALKELTGEGFLNRVAGVGTFVADRRAKGHPLSIRNIAEDIRSDGHRYSAEVITLQEEGAEAGIALSFGLKNADSLFHSVIVHLRDDTPHQYEDRFVNPAVAPDYLSQDFSQQTPYEYLTKIAPLQEAEHAVRAMMPPLSVRSRLNMAFDEPSLVIRRRTWTRGVVATVAHLYHPGSRFELFGSFKP